MPATIKDSNGKRIANRADPHRHLIPPNNLHIVVCDLLHEIGFNEPTPTKKHWSHRQDEKLKAYWANEVQHLWFEYKDLTDKITLNESLFVADTVQIILDFVRDVYERGK